METHWTSPKPGLWEYVWGATHVVAGKVVDLGLGQHAVVLELRLAERGRVAGNDDELGLAGSEGLERAWEILGAV